MNNQKKNRELLTLELLASIIAIAIAGIALLLVIENKPLLAGYKEIDCHHIQYEDGSRACIVKLDSDKQEVRVFTGAH